MLKAELMKHNISSSTFLKSFKKDNDVDISKSAFSLFLTKGIVPKKIKDFKIKIINTCRELNLNINNENYLTITKEDIMIESQNLNMNVLKHFSLGKDPFLPFLSKESEIVMLTSHYYALEMMRASRDTGQFTVVTSEVGGGKTTILGKFEAETNSMPEFLIIKVRTRDAERCTAKDILTACVYDLSQDKVKRGNEALSRQVEDLLKKVNKAGKRVILIIDEAQDLHTHTLKYLKRLWELRDGLAPLLGIIIIGQNELATKLYNQNNLAVREVTARTIHAPLDPINDDLTEYLTAKVKHGKGDIKNIISQAGIELLSTRLTITDRNGKSMNKAYPLEVGNRMKRLMNLAFEQGVRVIDNNFINEVGI